MIVSRTGEGSTIRLDRLMKNIKHYIDDDAFKEVIEVNDHKGDLYIHLKSMKYIDYLSSIFLTFWVLENELNVCIVLDGVVINKVSL